MVKTKRGRPRTGRARETVISIRFSDDDREALDWIAEKEPVSSFVRRYVVGHAKEAFKQFHRAETMALGYDQRGQKAEADECRDRARRDKVVAQTTPGHPAPIEAWEPFTGRWPDDRDRGEPSITKVFDRDAAIAEMLRLLKEGRR